jgi:hypothetical protein
MLRVTLFGGEVVQGLCTATSEDSSGAALPNATALEEAMFGPEKREITINDRTIAAGEIVSLEVLPPAE